MRAAAERARMADLERLLPVATTGLAGGRRSGLADRIAHRRNWADGLVREHDGWGVLASEVGEADVLVDEVVALLMTRLLRDAGLDQGAFDAAEAFCAELVALAGVPRLIVGQTQELESVDHTRASVAMRFPGARVWDLPFLAHEVGHHAATNLRHIEPELTDRRPLADVVDSVARDLLADGETATRAGSHANELVADAVATVCLGPTYPVACLYLRIPVSGATRSSDTHPSWVTRIATVRAVLDALADATGLPRYRSQRADLVDPLAETVLGRVPAASAAAERAAEATVRGVLRHRKGLAYRDADIAIAVADGLTAGHADPPAGATVTTVVDGAWRWRVAREDPAEDDRIAVLVARYCRIAAGGAP